MDDPHDDPHMELRDLRCTLFSHALWSREKTIALFKELADSVPSSVTENNTKNGQVVTVQGSIDSETTLHLRGLPDRVDIIFFGAILQRPNSPFPHAPAPLGIYRDELVKQKLSLLKGKPFSGVGQVSRLAFGGSSIIGFESKNLACTYLKSRASSLEKLDPGLVPGLQFRINPRHIMRVGNVDALVNRVCSWNVVEGFAFDTLGDNKKPLKHFLVITEIDINTSSEMDLQMHGASAIADAFSAFGEECVELLEKGDSIPYDNSI